MEFPLCVSEDCQELIRWLLQKEPERRPQSWAEIRGHRLFKGINWKQVRAGKAKVPWRPNLMQSHFNPKFTTLSIDEELWAMGVTDRRHSFYYEKVFGRHAGSKSVYRIPSNAKLDDDEFEFNLAKGKMYIKNFDFTGQSPGEDEMEQTINEF